MAWDAISALQIQSRSNRSTTFCCTTGVPIFGMYGLEVKSYVLVSKAIRYVRSRCADFSLSSTGSRTCQAAWTDVGLPKGFVGRQHVQSALADSIIIVLIVLLLCAGHMCRSQLAAVSCASSRERHAEDALEE